MNFLGWNSRAFPSGRMISRSPNKGIVYPIPVEKSRVTKFHLKSQDLIIIPMILHSHHSRNACLATSSIAKQKPSCLVSIWVEFQPSKCHFIKKETRLAGKKTGRRKEALNQSHTLGPWFHQYLDP